MQEKESTRRQSFSREQRESNEGRQSLTGMTELSRMTKMKGLFVIRPPEVTNHSYPTSFTRI